MKRFSWVFLWSMSVFSQDPNFSLLSPSDQTLAPFTLGCTFKKGDIPSGADVSATVTDFQADIKNRWPDGSAKFAIVAGRADLKANIPLKVTLSPGTAVAGSALTENDLLNTNITAAITFGAYGTAELRPLIGVVANLNASIKRFTAGRIRTWVSGPEMSSWVYYSPIGSDPHLAAWFEVRLYKGGKVEVLPSIENGYLMVASPGVKQGRATFTLNGATRYDSQNDANTTGNYSFPTVIDANGVVSMPHHTRIALVRGGVFSYWSGADPQITVKHDLTYLTETKVVPAYRPARISPASLNALTVTYNPMRTCYIDPAMGSTGYSPGIGVLPNESAMYLVSGDARAYRAVLSSGFSLGSYCIHYRDEMTHRPLRFTQRPTLTQTGGSDLPPTPGGGSAYYYASSHHPAAAYLPYLLSGWHYFLEEMQFQVTLHYLIRNNSYRDNANYYFNASAWGDGCNDQSGERAQAWQWRSMAMAASVTPDADTVMRGQFLTVLGYNATQFRQEFETGNSRNPYAVNTLGWGGFGWPTFGDGQAPWQDDFMTAAIGLTWDLEVVTDPAKKADLLWFRDHKYKAITGRLGRAGVAGEYGFHRAAQYHIPAGTISGSSFTFYPSWGATFTGAFGTPNNVVTNTLIDGNIGDGSVGLSTSYWGNLQPAIAYAVDHAAPGALEGYQRMTGADNWSAKAVQFETTPVWGVMPRSQKSASISSSPRREPFSPGLEAFPNPASGNLVIRLTGVAGNSPLVVTLYNSLGRKVVAGANPFQWNTGKLPAGIYLARAVVSGREQTAKVTILH